MFFKISRLAVASILAYILTILLCSAITLAQADAHITPLAIDTGPGSAEPRLSKGPTGTVVLSWLEPDGEASRLRFSTLGKEGWKPPRTVAKGDNWFVNWADFPSVVPISDSLWAAHWLSKRPGGVYAYDVSVALSHNAGASWGSVITPHRDGTATEHGFVSLFPWQDGIGLVWLDGRNMPAESSHQEHGEAGGMTLRSAVISADGSISSETQMDDLVCDCCQTGVAIARQGPVAAYRNRTDTEIRDIYVARSVKNQWQTGQAVADDGWEIAGCPVNGPAIAASGDDVAIAWFTMAQDLPRVRFARSDDGALTFGDALDIDSDAPVGRVGAVFLDDGSVAVSWLGSNAGQQGEIRVQIITAAGERGRQYVIAQTAVTRPAGFPQITQDGNSLILAWTDTSGEETRVRTARITLSQDF